MMNYRVSSLLDSVQICIETILLSPVIIGCSIEHFFQSLKELIEDAIYSQELYERLDFELREAKNDAWAENLVLADTRNDLRKQLIKRCRQNQEYCYLRFLNEGRTRALFWLKWQNRWKELEKFYKESEDM
jgi:hypothetical protein